VEGATLNDLAEELWALDAESDWTDDEVLAPDGGRRHLERYLRSVLRAVATHIHGVSHAYIAVTGLECGVFSPVAAIDRDLRKIHPTPTYGPGTLVASRLLQEESVQLISEPAAQAEFKGDSGTQEKLLVKLEAHGEFYGFMSIDSAIMGALLPSVVRVRATLPVLSHLIADATFSMQLRDLGSSFLHHENENPPVTLYRDMATRAAHGFGADGAVLRLYNRKDNRLVVVGMVGDVPSALVEEKVPGDGISGNVFAAPHDNAFTLTDSDKRAAAGVAISEEDERRLRALGIHSFMVMKLSSDVRSDQSSPALGTLSFFHRRPRRFSWRDIALFRSYCARVADTIRLHQTSLSHFQIAEGLRLQSLRVSEIETVALLAHDLGHKALTAGSSVEDYIDRCRKALNNQRERRSHEHLEKHATDALNSVVTIQNALAQVRSLWRRTELGREEEFEISAVVRDIEESLGGALAHYNVSISQRLPKVVLRGHKIVFSQALFNLVINSIEAIRDRRRSGRPATITVQAHEEQLGGRRRLIIVFSDDGPGIDRREFSDPNDIFLLGKTSKPTGSGTGLPAARSLLGRYFRGDLTLDDPATARFRIVVPLE
jgi:signal transduction histidine kinase